jgi:hypothetical protein
VHLRRALLLFAVVLGLAAIAASVSRPRTDAVRSDQPRATPPATGLNQTPTVSPTPDNSLPAAELTFVAADPQPQRIQPGQAATVLVDVEEPGQVEIADMGLSTVAEPLTPGRFEVLARASGRHSITFTPASGSGERQRVGTLVVAEE